MRLCFEGNSFLNPGNKSKQQTDAGKAGETVEKELKKVLKLKIHFNDKPATGFRKKKLFILSGRGREKILTK